MFKNKENSLNFVYFIYLLRSYFFFQVDLLNIHLRSSSTDKIMLKLAVIVVEEKKYRTMKRDFTLNQ